MPKVLDAGLERLAADGSALPTVNYYPNQADMDMSTGAWHCIEWHVKVNQPGQSNGMLEVWVDNQLDMEYQGQNFDGSTSSASPPWISRGSDR